MQFELSPVTQHLVARYLGELPSNPIMIERENR
jgi:hypothetical protein